MAIRRVWAQAQALTVAAASVFLAAGVVAAQPAPSAGHPAPSAGQPAPGPRRAGQQGQAREQWPKRLPMGDATLVLNAPRADSLADGKLSARSAARIEREGEGEPLLGTIWLDADVDVDRAARTVALAAVRVSKVEFPKMPQARQDRIAQRVGQWLTRTRPRLPLDDVLAQARFGRRRDEAAPNLNTEPPKILFETEPAILVVFDGEPRFRAVEGSKLERALNTPFLVLHDSAAGVYWLNGGASWFRAPDPKGPWSKDGNVPAAALQIASRDLKEGGVAESDLQQARQSADPRVPKILVATEPTELVVSDGPPKWTSLTGGGSEGLETLGNSESGVFRTADDRQIYIVLSGRWYRAGSFEGPWTYVQSDRLPESFRRIPADSASGDVLAFVPGTAAAQDAVEDAVKPRTAAVKRSEAHVDVTYDGDPRFEPVPGTHVEYAINTPGQVLKIRGRYYVVDNGSLVHGRCAERTLGGRRRDSRRGDPGDPAAESRLQHAVRLGVRRDAGARVHGVHPGVPRLLSVLRRRRLRDGLLLPALVGPRSTTRGRGRGVSTRGTRRGPAGATASAGVGHGAASATRWDTAGGRAGWVPEASIGRRFATSTSRGT